MAGRYLSASYCLIEKPETVSVVAPRRSTTILSGEPASSIAASSPATSAITMTNTTTTSAIPPPVMTLETRRTSRLRRLYLSGIPISRDRPDDIDDIAPCSSGRRHDRAQQADQRGGSQRGKKHRQ